MIQNIIFGILFLKILFRAYDVFIFVHTFQWTLSEFLLIFRFYRRKSPFWIFKFSSKHVSVWCQKKYLHRTISWHLRTAFLKHFESKCFVFLYISVRKCFFQRSSKVLSDGDGLVGGWIVTLTLHKKWSLPLRISSVNVTKSAGNCGFGHIYWRNP